MLRLHQTTERRICRGAFLGLCALPTLAIVAWCATRNLPSHARGYERELSRRLGLDARLEAVEHLRPGELELVGLRLLDPENGQLVVHLMRLGVRESDGALLLRADEVTIHRQQVHLLADALARQMRRIQPDVAAMNLRVDRLTLTSPGEFHKLEKLQAALRADDERAQFFLGFPLTTKGDSQQARFWLTRTRRPAATTIAHLDTGGARMPVSLLSLDGRRWELLGPQSELRGKLTARRADAQQEGTWDVDLTSAELVDVARQTSEGAAAYRQLAELAHHCAGMLPWLPAVEPRND